MNVAIRPEHINLISLCTGGGGLDLGVELAMPSARSIVLVEREAFAASHLVAAMQKGLMAPAAIWSDVTTFNGRPWRGLVDGLIGGIPCQPHSLAGKRLGEDDERDLWSDARRIIVQSGAWFVLIENVRGIVSSGGAERVWRDLRRLGFDVEAGLFTASEVGASHERERWFCLAVADSEGPFWRPQLQQGGARSGRTGLAGVCREDVAAARHDGRTPRASGREFEQEPPISEQLGRGGGSMVHAGRSERRPHIISRSDGNGEDSRGSEAASRVGEPSSAVAHANLAIVRGQSSAGQQPQLQRDDALSLFPPGPSDLSRWRRTLERAPDLEPAFRRVADGLASRLDVARVDRLRMLGNGVVCLEGANAFRTLASRLAASGSSGAARLVRAMELMAA